MRMDKVKEKRSSPGPTKEEDDGGGHPSSWNAIRILLESRNPPPLPSLFVCLSLKSLE